MGPQPGDTPPLGSDNCGEAQGIIAELGGDAPQNGPGRSCSSHPAELPSASCSDRDVGAATGPHGLLSKGFSPPVGNPASVGSPGRQPSPGPQNEAQRAAFSPWVGHRPVPMPQPSFSLGPPASAPHDYGDDDAADDDDVDGGDLVWPMLSRRQSSFCPTTYYNPLHDQRSPKGRLAQVQMQLQHTHGPPPPPPPQQQLSNQPSEDASQEGQTTVQWQQPEDAEGGPETGTQVPSASEPGSGPSAADAAAVAVAAASPTDVRVMGAPALLTPDTGTSGLELCTGSDRGGGAGGTHGSDTGAGTGQGRVSVGDSGAAGPGFNSAVQGLAVGSDLVPAVSSDLDPRPRPRPQPQPQGNPHVRPGQRLPSTLQPTLRDDGRGGVQGSDGGSGGGTGPLAAMAAAMAAALCVIVGANLAFGGPASPLLPSPSVLQLKSHPHPDGVPPATRPAPHVAHWLTTLCSATYACTGVVVLVACGVQLYGVLVQGGCFRLRRRSGTIGTGAIGGCSDRRSHGHVPHTGDLQEWALQQPPPPPPSREVEQCQQHQQEPLQQQQQQQDVQMRAAEQLEHPEGVGHWDAALQSPFVTAEATQYRFSSFGAAVGDGGSAGAGASGAMSYRELSHQAWTFGGVGNSVGSVGSNLRRALGMHGASNRNAPSLYSWTFSGLFPSGHMSGGGANTRGNANGGSWPGPGAAACPTSTAAAASTTIAAAAAAAAPTAAAAPYAAEAFNNGGDPGPAVTAPPQPRLHSRLLPAGPETAPRTGSALGEKEGVSSADEDMVSDQGGPTTCPAAAGAAVAKDVAVGRNAPIGAAAGASAIGCRTSTAAAIGNGSLTSRWWRTLLPGLHLLGRTSRGPVWEHASHASMPDVRPAGRPNLPAARARSMPAAPSPYSTAQLLLPGLDPGPLNSGNSLVRPAQSGSSGGVSGIAKAAASAAAALCSSLFCPPRSLSLSTTGPGGGTSLTAYCSGAGSVGVSSLRTSGGMVMQMVSDFLPRVAGSLAPRTGSNASLSMLADPFGGQQGGGMGSPAQQGSWGPGPGGARMLLLSGADASRKPAFSDLQQNAGRVQVLSVDDEPVNQQVMRALLWASEYDVLEARSGEEALELVRNCKVLPDLVLLDVTLGGDISGFEVCREIRREYSPGELPVIMITCSSLEEDVIRGLAVGANDYMIKPLRNLELVARIKTQLALKRSIRVAAEARVNMSLLGSILPANVIKQLKQGVTLIAQFHQEVTILFSDIRGFTNLATEWPTEQIILMLNNMFTAFDRLCDDEGVYKVETIGDAYMIVSGHDGVSEHAPRMLRMATRMLEAVSDMRGYDGRELQIRVGIHTGPAHSGVVGLSRPRYCFFGDTVNTASRMESTGFPMAIQVSESTMRAVTSQPEWAAEFHFAPCGPRDIKGKGTMHTYLLCVGLYEQALAELAAAAMCQKRRAGSLAAPLQQPAGTAAPQAPTATRAAAVAAAAPEPPNTATMASPLAPAPAAATVSASSSTLPPSSAATAAAAGSAYSGVGGGVSVSIITSPFQSLRSVAVQGLDYVILPTGPPPQQQQDSLGEGVLNYTSWRYHHALSGHDVISSTGTNALMENGLTVIVPSSHVVEGFAVEPSDHMSGTVGGGLVSSGANSGGGMAAAAGAIAAAGASGAGRHPSAPLTTDTEASTSVCLEPTFSAPSAPERAEAANGGGRARLLSAAAPTTLMPPSASAGTVATVSMMTTPSPPASTRPSQDLFGVGSSASTVWGTVLGATNDTCSASSVGGAARAVPALPGAVAQDSGPNPAEGRSGAEPNAVGSVGNGSDGGAHRVGARALAAAAAAVYERVIFPPAGPTTVSPGSSRTVMATTLTAALEEVDEPSLRYAARHSYGVAGGGAGGCGPGAGGDGSSGGRGQAGGGARALRAATTVAVAPRPLLLQRSRVRTSEELSMAAAAAAAAAARGSNCSVDDEAEVAAAAAASSLLAQGSVDGAPMGLGSEALPGQTLGWSILVKAFDQTDHDTPRGALCGTADASDSLGAWLEHRAGGPAAVRQLAPAARAAAPPPTPCYRNGMTELYDATNAPGGPNCNKHNNNNNNNNNTSAGGSLAQDSVFVAEPTVAVAAEALTAAVDSVLYGDVECVAARPLARSPTVTRAPRLRWSPPLPTPDGSVVACERGAETFVATPSSNGSSGLLGPSEPTSRPGTGTGAVVGATGAGALGASASQLYRTGSHGGVVQSLRLSYEMPTGASCAPGPNSSAGGSRVPPATAAGGTPFGDSGVASATAAVAATAGTAGGSGTAYLADVAAPRGNSVGGLPSPRDVGHREYWTRLHVGRRPATATGAMNHGSAANAAVAAHLLTQNSAGANMRTPYGHGMYGSSLGNNGPHAAFSGWGRGSPYNNAGAVGTTAARPPPGTTPELWSPNWAHYHNHHNHHPYSSHGSGSATAPGYRGVVPYYARGTEGASGAVPGQDEAGPGARRSRGIPQGRGEEDLPGANRTAAGGGVPSTAQPTPGTVVQAVGATGGVLHQGSGLPGTGGPATSPSLLASAGSMGGVSIISQGWSNLYDPLVPRPRLTDHYYASGDLDESQSGIRTPGSIMSPSLGSGHVWENSGHVSPHRSPPNLTPMTSNATAAGTASAVSKVAAGGGGRGGGRRSGDFAAASGAALSAPAAQASLRDGTGQQQSQHAAATPVAVEASAAGPYGSGFAGRTAGSRVGEVSYPIGADGPFVVVSSEPDDGGSGGAGDAAPAASPALSPGQQQQQQLQGGTQQQGQGHALHVQQPRPQQQQQQEHQPRPGQPQQQVRTAHKAPGWSIVAAEVERSDASLLLELQRDIYSHLHPQQLLLAPAKSASKHSNASPFGNVAAASIVRSTSGEVVDDASGGSGAGRAGGSGGGGGRLYRSQSLDVSRPRIGAVAAGHNIDPAAAPPSLYGSGLSAQPPAPGAAAAVAAAAGLPGYEHLEAYIRKHYLEWRHHPSGRGLNLGSHAGAAIVAQRRSADPWVRQPQQPGSHAAGRAGNAGMLAGWFGGTSSSGGSASRAELAGLANSPMEGASSTTAASTMAAMPAAAATAAGGWRGHAARSPMATAYNGSNSAAAAAAARAMTSPQQRRPGGCDVGQPALGDSTLTRPPHNGTATAAADIDLGRRDSFSNASGYALPYSRDSYVIPFSRDSVDLPAGGVFPRSSVDAGATSPAAAVAARSPWYGAPPPPSLHPDAADAPAGPVLYGRVAVGGAVGGAAGELRRSLETQKVAGSGSFSVPAAVFSSAAEGPAAAAGAPGGGLDIARMLARASEMVVAVPAAGGAGAGLQAGTLQQPSPPLTPSHPIHRDGGGPVVAGVAAVAEAAQPGLIPEVVPPPAAPPEALVPSGLTYTGPVGSGGGAAAAAFHYPHVHPHTHSHHPLHAHHHHHHVHHHHPYGLGQPIVAQRLDPVEEGGGSSSAVTADADSSSIAVNSIVAAGDGVAREEPPFGGGGGGGGGVAAAARVALAPPSDVALAANDRLSYTLHAASGSECRGDGQATQPPASSGAGGAAAAAAGVARGDSGRGRPLQVPGGEGVQAAQAGRQPGQAKRSFAVLVRKVKRALYAGGGAGEPRQDVVG